MDDDLPSPASLRPHLRGLAPPPADAAPVAQGAALAASFATSHAGVIAFLTVATEGSFAKAGDRLGIGRSAVSRSVQKLEAQLDARLFLRTTRRTALTREGELFYENCRPGVERIVQALEDMRELRRGPPRGHLRIGASVGFGRRLVAPLLAGFQAAHPEISIELGLDDGPVDFSAADRVDLWFREGRLEDSRVIAQRLVSLPVRLCASPAYADRHGLPQGLDDLARHRGVGWRQASGRVAEWEFQVGGQLQRWPPVSTLTFNDPDLVLQAVLDGQGLAQLPGYQACEALRSRRLVDCLPQHAPADRGLWVCYLSRRQLPARIRVFIDHMAERIRALDLACEPPGAQPVAA